MDIDTAHGDLVAARQALESAKRTRATARVNLAKAIQTFGGLKGSAEERHLALSRQFCQQSIADRAAGIRPAGRPANPMAPVAAGKRRGSTGLVRGGRVA